MPLALGRRRRYPSGPGDHNLSMPSINSSSKSTYVFGNCSLFDRQRFVCLIQNSPLDFLLQLGAIARTRDDLDLLLDQDMEDLLEVRQGVSWFSVSEIGRTASRIGKTPSTGIVIRHSRIRTTGVIIMLVCEQPVAHIGGFLNVGVRSWPLNCAHIRYTDRSTTGAYKEVMSFFLVPE